MIFDRVLFKFLLVGVINTLAGAAIMFLLYNLAGCGYWISSAASYIAGGVLSFFLNKYFTFNQKTWNLRMLVFFALTVLTSYLLAYGIAKPLVYMILKTASPKIRGNAALAIGMCLYTGLNYLGQRFIVFVKKT